MSVNLDRFAEAVKEAMREQAEALIQETVKRRPWSVTFITRDGCKRETQMQWDDGPPDEITIPFWSEDGRHKAGERLYGRGAYFSQSERIIHYYEKEAPKPKPRRWSRDVFDMQIRNFWHFQWDDFAPKKPEPVKPLHVKVPTPEEIKRYSFAPDRPPEIIRVDNIHDDWIDPLPSPPPYFVPRREVWKVV